MSPYMGAVAHFVLSMCILLCPATLICTCSFSRQMNCSHVCSQQTTFLLLPTTCSPMRNGSYLTRSSWYSITSLTTQSQCAVASKWLEKLRPIADQERRKSNSEGAQRAERRAKVQRVRRIADLPVLQPYISFLLICELNILNGPL